MVRQKYKDTVQKDSNIVHEKLPIQYKGEPQIPCVLKDACPHAIVYPQRLMKVSLIHELEPPVLQSPWEGESTGLDTIHWQHATSEIA